MATSTATVVRALREIRYIDLYTATADVPETVTDHGLDVLSRMMATWGARGLRILDADLVFTATVTSDSRELTTLENDDDIKSLVDIFPGMYVSGTGIPTGAKVTKVEGSTVFLDQEATASGSEVELTFTDLPLDEKFEDAVISCLAIRLCPSTGMTPSPELREAADAGWRMLQGYFMATGQVQFDRALMATQNTAQTASYDGTE